MIDHRHTQLARRRWRQRALGLLLACLCLGALAPQRSGAAELAARQAAGAAQAVPTFHSIGLSWSPLGGSASQIADLRYRPLGSADWRTGYPLWFDARNGEYRGSLVQLTANTTYEISLSLRGGSASAQLQASTWSEQFPIAKTVQLPAGTSKQPLTISQSGTPGGYILYTAPAGQQSTIDAANASDYNIVVNASYIIIRGLTLKNARKSGIRLYANAHDVVIERNDISGWGRVAADGWGASADAAIYASEPSVSRVIVQRNRLHHPRADSNSWLEQRASISKTSSGWHPTGPQALSFYETAGNHVIRYNEIFSDADHYFSDCLGGGSSTSARGFPNRDSDIYANRIERCWDDAIESEGGNNNVRIWGNFMNQTYQHIAIRDTIVGPIYIWRNVAGISRMGPAGTSDDDPRGAFLKAGGGDGAVFVFHNTILQPAQPAPLRYPLGSSRGFTGSKMTNTVSRNNILAVYRADTYSIDGSTSVVSNSFNYDLYTGLLKLAPGQEAQGIRRAPIYDSRNAPGQYTLDATSPGFDAGSRIPNFNDGYSGAAPDMGAQEAGAAPLQFGVGAYR